MNLFCGFFHKNSYIARTGGRVRDKNINHRFMERRAKKERKTCAIYFKNVLCIAKKFPAHYCK